MDHQGLEAQVGLIVARLDQLDRIEERLSVIEEKVGAITTVPQAVKFEEAARLLSCGLTVLKEMVADKRIRTTGERIGERERIPMAEIFRLTAMRQPPKKAPAPVAANLRAQKQAKQKRPGDAIRELAKKKD